MKLFIRLIYTHYSNKIIKNWSIFVKSGFYFRTLSTPISDISETYVFINKDVALRTLNKCINYLFCCSSSLPPSPSSSWSMSLSCTSRFKLYRIYCANEQVSQIQWTVSACLQTTTNGFQKQAQGILLHELLLIHWHCCVLTWITVSAASVCKTCDAHEYLFFTQQRYFPTVVRTSGTSVFERLLFLKRLLVQQSKICQKFTYTFWGTLLYFND